MALLDAATIATALATLFEDRIAWQINRAVVLPQLLQVKPQVGKNISWVNRFGVAAPAGAAITDGTAVSVYNSDTKTPATLGYGIYHDAFSTTGFARAVAANTGNPNELVDLFGEELMESATRLAMALSTEFYSGTGATNRINGLLAASGAAPGIGATGTYATIDRGTNAQWRSTVMANGGTPRPLSFGLMREMRRRIYTACGAKPDLIVCDPTQHEKYANLFGNERRYMQSVNIRGQQIVLDGGMQVLEFDGIPIVEDISHPAGSMTFLNTNHVFIRPLPDSSTTLAQSPGSVALAGTPEEQFGVGRVGIAARIQPLAVLGDAFPYALYSYLQIQVKGPRFQGSLQDLDQ